KDGRSENTHARLFRGTMYPKAYHFGVRNLVMGRKRGVPHRSKVKMAHDRREIAQRHLRGESQETIGKALGLSQQSVSRDLKHLQQAWLHDAAQDVAARKSRELAKLDLLEQTYWQAWENSKGEKSRHTQVIRPGAGKDAHPEVQLLTV